MEEMMNKMKHYPFGEIFVATLPGSVYSVLPNGHKTSLKQREFPGGHGEITSLGWGRHYNEVVIGFQNGGLRFQNTIVNEFGYDYICSDKACPIVGVTASDTDIYGFKENGDLNYYNEESWGTSWRINTKGKKIKKFVASPYRTGMFGIGGEEYDLEIHDFEYKTDIFKAKKDRTDDSDLIEKICVTGINFFPEKWCLDVATVTKEGQIRFYDTRAQRRPVKLYKNVQSTFKCITGTVDRNHLVAGCNHGFLSVFDFRKLTKAVKVYKYDVGTITDVIGNDQAPIIATASLGRYLTVYHLDNSGTEFKEYMRFPMTKVIMNLMNDTRPLWKSVNEPTEPQEVILGPAIMCDPKDIKDYESDLSDSAESEVNTEENKEDKESSGSEIEQPSCSGTSKRTLRETKNSDTDSDPDYEPKRLRIYQ